MKLLRRTPGMTIHPTKMVAIGARYGGDTWAELIRRPPGQIAAEVNGEFYRILVSPAMPAGEVWLMDTALLEHDPVDTPGDTVF